MCYDSNQSISGGLQAAAGAGCRWASADFLLRWILHIKAIKRRRSEGNGQKNAPRNQAFVSGAAEPAERGGMRGLSAGSVHHEGAGGHGTAAGGGRNAAAGQYLRADRQIGAHQHGYHQPHQPVYSVRKRRLSHGGVPAAKRLKTKIYIFCANRRQHYTKCRNVSQFTVLNCENGILKLIFRMLIMKQTHLRANRFCICLEDK